MRWVIWKRSGHEEKKVIYPSWELSPSLLCFRQQCAFLFLTFCMYKPWVRGASALKAPFWSPWTDNDYAASLLSTTQALHAVVPASTKQSLHNRATISMVLRHPLHLTPTTTPAKPLHRSQYPTARKLTPYMTLKGTQLLVGCHGQSCLSIEMPKTGIVQGSKPLRL